MVIWVNQIYLLTLKIIETINMTSTPTAKPVDLTTEEKVDDSGSNSGLIGRHFDRMVRLLHFWRTGDDHFHHFFPASNPTAAYLSVLATFAAGFIVRPFGALVFGRLGDLVGRKYTFLLTLIIMGGSTFAIGLVPSYAAIGAAAPLLVLLLRLLQGLALGGEYGGAATDAGAALTRPSTRVLHQLDSNHGYPGPFPGSRRHPFYAQLHGGSQFW